uniref:F-box protein SKIP24 n=2 Tax=Kalanchoe fedtschenkoi TaxID=63787 RepID=A0A7N0VJH5_KALFE
MSALPDELWRRILEMGITCYSLTYKELCFIGISCRRLRRLSEENEFWSVLVSRDFPQASCTADSLTSKSLYRVRFERDKERKQAAHRRAVLRTESLVWDSERKLKELEARIGDEVDKMKAASLELSNLRKAREASVALNVWQPETIRRWQKQTVEQCAVSVESRVTALEMEVKLCKQQISVFDKAYKSVKQRLQTTQQQLAVMKYHPINDYKTATASDATVGSNTSRKKLKTKISGDPISPFI